MVCAKKRGDRMGSRIAKIALHNAAALAVALVMAFGAFQFFASMQGRFFPVVSKAEIVDLVQTKEGVVFYLKFSKNYNCDFVGVNWYLGDHRLQLDFIEDNGRSPLSRPPGGQNAGPWILRGVATLVGTRASAVHRCPPGLWQTHTDFFPN